MFGIREIKIMDTNAIFYEIVFMEFVSTWEEAEKKCQELNQKLKKKKTKECINEEQSDET